MQQTFKLELTERQLDLLDKYLAEPLDDDDVQGCADILEQVYAVQLAAGL
jgi:hypothetical protein